KKSQKTHAWPKRRVRARMRGRAWRYAKEREKMVHRRKMFGRKKGHIQERREHAHWRRRARKRPRHKRTCHQWFRGAYRRSETWWGWLKYQVARRNGRHASRVPNGHYERTWAHSTRAGGQWCTGPRADGRTRRQPAGSSGARRYALMTDRVLRSLDLSRSRLRHSLALDDRCDRLARKLRPYFLNHVILVRTNFQLGETLGRPTVSGRLVKWAVELSEFSIKYEPRRAIEAQSLADFIQEGTKGESKKWMMHVDGSSSARGS
ncbi:Unknown protein, partial [Striga hermonthica]